MTATTDEKDQREAKATGRGLTVVIPSKNVDNLNPCVAAIRTHEPSARIIVIDDGILIDNPEDDRFCSECEVITGPKPFVFARNCNIGIKAAGDDDIVLLNDDALLESPGGFTRMQRFASEHPEVGLVSATTNHAGNPEQHRRVHRPIGGFPVAADGFRILNRNTPGNSFPTVAFVCVLIPRRTLDTIGLLDERFDPGMYEDNDYCRRVFNAGKQIAIADSCYVDHGSLRPTFRSGPAVGAKLEQARKIYMDKWGSA